MVICLQRGADLHTAQLMPLPLTISYLSEVSHTMDFVVCVCEVYIGFAFMVPAHPGSPGQRAIKRVCVWVCNLYYNTICTVDRERRTFYSVPFLMTLDDSELC